MSRPLKSGEVLAVLRGLEPSAGWKLDLDQPCRVACTDGVVLCDVKRLMWRANDAPTKYTVDVYKKEDDGSWFVVQAISYNLHKAVAAALIGYRSQS